MKWFLLCFVIVGALAEPPRFRPARFGLQRQELLPTTTDSPTEPTTETEGPYSGAPYPPAGWKPAGELLTLPNEKVPVDISGALEGSGYPPSGWKPAGKPFILPRERPASSYGVPNDTYGAPDSTGPPAESTTMAAAERMESSVEVQKSVGTYYVLLPNGQLHQVEVLEEGDLQNIGYSAPLLLLAP